MTISILMDICIICEFWNTGGFNRKRKKTLHLIILDFIYRVLKLSHNNTIRIWFLPDFARWWIPSQAMTKTVGTLGPRSRYVYTISTCLMPGMSSNFPRPLLLWLHKKNYSALYCNYNPFSHDTMTPFEVYAFADILSSNIILPLRWTDIIIVAIFCPPYMYCIIYNLEYI